MVLLDVTISEIDQFFGSAASQMIGSNPLVAGLLLAAIFLIMAFKFNLGIEATLVIGGFFILLTTSSMIGAAGSGGLLPAGILIVFALVVGWAIYRGLSREF